MQFWVCLRMPPRLKSAALTGRSSAPTIRICNPSLILLCLVPPQPRTRCCVIQNGEPPTIEAAAR
jgi:hypothetical protein